MNISPRLIVSDPDRASVFYQDALGAEQVFRAPPGDDDDRPTVVDHRLGGSSFRVSPAVSAWGWLSPSDLNGSAVLLEIEVEDPDAVGERMTANGAEVVVPIENRPYGKRSGRMRDPFGPVDHHRRASLRGCSLPSLKSAFRWLSVSHGWWSLQASFHMRVRFRGSSGVPWRVPNTYPQEAMVGRARRNAPAAAGGARRGHEVLVAVAARPGPTVGSWSAAREASRPPDARSD